MGGWNWEPSNHDHIDFEHEWMEREIKRVAKMLFNNISELDIIDYLKTFTPTSEPDMMFLIIKSAQLLNKYRK